MEQETYQCHICWQTASKPVVTPCGHLFCWVCIYQWLRSNQQYLSCPTCKSGLQVSMLRAILVPGQQVQKMQNGIPPRPRPIRRNRPRKIKKNKNKQSQQQVDYLAYQQKGQLPKSIRKISMNMYRGVLLAGYGLFPSCYSMLSQNHKKILPNQEAIGTNVEYKYSLMLEFWAFILFIFVMISMLYL